MLHCSSTTGLFLSQTISFNPTRFRILNSLKPTTFVLLGLPNLANFIANFFSVSMRKSQLLASRKVKIAVATLFTLLEPQKSASTYSFRSHGHGKLDTRSANKNNLPSSLFTIILLTLHHQKGYSLLRMGA